MAPTPTGSLGPSYLFSLSPGGAAALPHFGYVNQDGAFLLQGPSCSALYAFKTSGKFHADEFAFNKLGVASFPEGATFGWVYQHNTEPFWLFFAQGSFASPRPYDTYRLAYSFNRIAFIPWITDSFTTH